MDLLGQVLKDKRVWMLDHILVVCIGNICRSPMAEALLKEKLSLNQMHVSVSSAGIQALVGRGADSTSRALMEEKGLNIASHRARQASPELLFSADLILTMSSEQNTQLETINPCIRGRVHRLGKWGGFDIPDPFQRPRIIFVQALQLIEQGIDEWCRILWKK